MAQSILNKVVNRCIAEGSPIIKEMKRQQIYLQAIETKWIAPTNVRGSKVKASCHAGSLTLHWDHAKNVEDNHRTACDALVAKLGWDGEFIGGVIRNGVYVFVRNVER